MTQLSKGSDSFALLANIQGGLRQMAGKRFAINRGLVAVCQAQRPLQALLGIQSFNELATTGLSVIGAATEPTSPALTSTPALPHRFNIRRPGAPKLTLQ